MSVDTLTLMLKVCGLVNHTNYILLVLSYSSNDRFTSMSISLTIIDNTFVSEAASSIESSTISSL